VKAGSDLSSIPPLGFLQILPSEHTPP
jgi:hypothetical protein